MISKLLRFRVFCFAGVGLLSVCLFTLLNSTISFCSDVSAKQPTVFSTIVADGSTSDDQVPTINVTTTEDVVVDTTDVKPSSYLIQDGDTLCDISKLFDYSVQEIAELNHIYNPDLIYKDSILRIPKE